MAPRKMTLTEEEANWIEELRAVRLGNPETPIQHFTFIANERTAEIVGEVAHMALEVEAMEREGDLFAFAIKVARDPSVRRTQYHTLMQLVTQRLGPREGEEFQIYFDPSLQMS